MGDRVHEKKGMYEKKGFDAEAQFLETLIEFQYGVDVKEDLRRLSGSVSWAKGWPENIVAFWNVEAFLWGQKISSDVRGMISSVLGSFCSGNILDLGCGAYSYTSGVGFDISAKMLSFNENCRVKVVGDVEKTLPFKDSEFDCVTAVFLLNYVHNITGLLNEAKRVVKEGGKFVAVLNGKPVDEWQRQKEVPTKTKGEWVRLFGAYFDQVRLVEKGGLWFFFCAKEE